MIRPTHRPKNCRPNQGALIELVDPIEKEYIELLNLREQVREAEAAAERLRQRRKSAESIRPLARVVQRRPITRQPGEFTKSQLYAMLADAVRNTV